jgi:hypothetical protein
MSTPAAHLGEPSQDDVHQNFIPLIPLQASLGSGHPVIRMQKESVMRYIPTPGETVERLKKQAKELQRSGADKHSDLPNCVAKQAGYDHWHHVQRERGGRHSRRRRRMSGLGRAWSFNRSERTAAIAARPTSSRGPLETGGGRSNWDAR